MTKQLYIATNSASIPLAANAIDTPPGDYLPIAWPHKTAVWALWGPYKTAAAKHGINPDWDHYQNVVVGLLEREARDGLYALDQDLEKKVIALAGTATETAHLRNGTGIAPNNAQPKPRTDADEISRRMGIPSGAEYEEWVKQFETESREAPPDWIERRLRGGSAAAEGGG